MRTSFILQMMGRHTHKVVMINFIVILSTILMCAVSRHSSFICRTIHSHSPFLCVIALIWIIEFSLTVVSWIMDDITNRMSSKLRNCAKIYRLNWFWARRHWEIKTVSTETPERLKHFVLSQSKLLVWVQKKKPLRDYSANARKMGK